MARSPPTTIAAQFVRKLYRILEHESSLGVISWDTSGESFSIHDETRFEVEVLPRYMRCHMKRFRAQLLEYGFEPVVATYRILRNGALQDVEAYYHGHFSRGRPERLSKIKSVSHTRKQDCARSSMESIIPAPASRIDKLMCRRCGVEPREPGKYAISRQQEDSPVNLLARLVTMSASMPDADPTDLTQRPQPTQPFQQRENTARQDASETNLRVVNYDSGQFSEETLASMLQLFGGPSTSS